jgi:hypothetical protein
MGVETHEPKPGKGRFFMEPDYTPSVLEVYAKAAHLLINSEESLSMLSCIEQGDVLADRRPSWVPTWDAEFTRPLAGYGPNDCFLAGNVANVDRGILQLYGLKVGTVDIALKTVHHHKQDIIRFDDRLNSHGRFLELFKNHDGDHQRRKLCWTLTAGRSWNGLPTDNPEQHIADFEYYFRHTGQGVPKWKDPLEQHKPDWRRFARATANIAMKRKLLFTTANDVGLGSAAAKQDDEIWVVAGGSSLLILRRAGNGKHLLVGECYVFSMLDVVAQWRTSPVEALERCSKILLT